MRALFTLIATLGLIAAPPLAAQSRTDQETAREQMQAGRTMPLREIERKIIPQMKGNEYLGPEYDGNAGVYRLKFIDNAKGQVIWVDVDPRTAKILRVSR